MPSLRKSQRLGQPVSRCDRKVQRWAGPHHHISCDEAAIPAADTFQFALKSISGRSGVEKLHPSIAAEGDEVQAALILISDWLDVHSLPILVRAKAHPPAKSAGRMGQPHFGNHRKNDPQAPPDFPSQARLAWLLTLGPTSLSLIAISPLMVAPPFPRFVREGGPSEKSTPLQRTEAAAAEQSVGVASQLQAFVIRALQ
jgi:hypothetical protein